MQDVLPALKTNTDGLKQVLDELVKQYKGKQDEMDKLLKGMFFEKGIVKEGGELEVRWY